MLSNQLHTLKILKVGSIEEYNNKATNVKNQLMSIEESSQNISIYQLLLDGLLMSFKRIVQTLSNLYTIFSFYQLIVKLLTKPIHQV